MNYGNTNQLQTIGENAPPIDNLNQSFTGNQVQDHSATAHYNITAATPVDNHKEISYIAGRKISLQPGFAGAPTEGNSFQGSIEYNQTPGSEWGGFNNEFPSSDPYEYDINGNLIRDPHKQLDIQYNYLNLPSAIDYGNLGNLTYIYTATGEKLTKQSGFSKSDLERREYCSGIEYGFHLDESNNDSSYPFQLEAIYHTEGRAVQKNGIFEYQYNLADHLGNNRILFRDDGTGYAEIIQENHYYPFGLAMRGAWEANNGEVPEHRYLYNGKELDTDFGLNWYHYGARMYDPAIGRFPSIDPKSESFAFQSPYVYAANDPIKYIDKNGENPILGGLIGLVSEVSVQVISNIATGQEWDKIDWADVGVATVAGAATGGFASIAKVKKGVKLASAIAGGTAGQAFEAGVDVEGMDGGVKVSITGAQLIYPDEGGKTFDVNGTNVTVEGKNGLDTALDLGFDKLGDVVKTVGSAIKNIEVDKVIKRKTLELRRAMIGSAGEATRKKQLKNATRTANINNTVIDMAVDNAADVAKDKIKKDLEN